ncbi:DNA-binding protein [Candidatus Atribacteria bacterium 1244-E10-H5-B2]|nr:MAG: DNA-binding protein [Candidatus Atribacteria bacterium 1244-E10-H5-B2]
MMKILEEASKIVNGVKFYNTDKVSKILKTSRITVARYFREGRFPPVKFAGKYHMSQEDLLAYISTGAVIKPIPFSEFLTYKEIKQFDSNILRATKKKLEKIEEIIKRNKEKVKYIDNPKAKIALENYILRYKKIKKDIEMAEKEPISSDDIF